METGEEFDSPCSFYASFWASPQLDAIVSGFQLFCKAEELHAQGKADETFEYYQKAIKKITKDEDPLAEIPARLPYPTFPQETLGAVWRNFLGFLRDPQMRKVKDNSPEAYNLLKYYRPNSSHPYPRFQTEEQKLYLKGMQITAAATIGLLAWDSRDRPTAVKRYREAIVLAATHPGYDSESRSTTNWERCVAGDIRETRDNLTVLLENDERNARIYAEVLGMVGKGGQRRDVLDGVGIIRVEADGTIKFVRDTTIASDKCGSCDKRDVKLMKCSACKKASYCNAACQKADWKNHKSACNFKAAKTSA
ncbi:Histone-lysine N-methyltransferase smyd1 [Marasmius tenuissimus]|uniref:Histone-lysine N-methyltransferase smyd1 n=1 Tax=Marasmius tenuissimus TaxID=585030 RepID=A0ABR3ABY9_9AGAR